MILRSTTLTVSHSIDFKKSKIRFLWPLSKDTIKNFSTLGKGKRCLEHHTRGIYSVRYTLAARTFASLLLID